MEERYRWSSGDLQTLRTTTQAAHSALVEAAILMRELTSDMEGDTTWTGDHKLEFVVWMDLIRQYQERLADESVGGAAVKVLDDFLSSLDGFYDSSPLFASAKAWRGV